MTIFWILYDRNKVIKFYSLATSLIITLIIISPNIYWNIENGLSTLQHTIHNANITGFYLNPDEALNEVRKKRGRKPKLQGYKTENLTKEYVLDPEKMPTIFVSESTTLTLLCLGYGIFFNYFFKFLLRIASASS